ncbi:glycoside hydrolase family 3 domain protein [Ruminiclostridium papyrosolvens DSM 2782]|uniref:Glycoside hydrolase family 3 domain protein n=1 Tax=Ruminiclostridium papyrosolvens DSM 2782 TaxID=588581 RepID=F1TD25_9FIRM|nr:glycoside hydrolase family 3 C-terminal domain-containing protein [Ruminiclostridium papyrosolvens]EGD47892.1 glycoside hydrolase family 3 domain protein [Ruminiclostridium papyrosolvens DSM 2782]WES34605.1 glycoside hydrolase family 3 C-terminal domain-containing protein [Ruminiclostridium papyrosolvens DSM 2782]
MDKPKYLDKSLSFKERAADLVSKMTLEEKASQLRYDAQPVERLGIPRYNWWNEALHGVARAGVATVFPQAIGMAAMFDDEFLEKIADVIATEGRAKYNESAKKGDRDIYKGITFWSPNVNIFRDPRWGRGHETYGEDPYLTSRLGVAFVKGLQGDGKYLKTAACAKHYAVHSGPEDDRHFFDAIVSQKDLYETYLPAFEALVKEAKVESIMGAYNRTNGEPCNGSKTLLKDILRDGWGFDGHVVSDCWAIKDFHEGHGVTKTPTESVALALKSGCDLNCGNMYLLILLALKEGLITEEDIDRAAIRLMTTRMKLGMFDDDCEFDNIPYELNDSAEHNKISLEAAKKSMVLLKNDGLLPLDSKKIKNVAVIGPNADSSLALRANYSGTPSQNVTIIEGIRKRVSENTRVWYAMGSHLFLNRDEDLAQPDDRLKEAVSAAERSDVVVLCLGLDASVEGEQNDQGTVILDAGGDKADLNLPESQRNLLNAVLATGKPTIVALLSGSALSIGDAADKAAAIVQCWYPGAIGGLAFAEMIFGDYSPAGRLPVTFYKSTEELPPFADYSMENRTYKFMKGDALYPFGFGLSYTSFEYSNMVCPQTVNNGENLSVSVDVQNTGSVDSDEVVQVYIKDMDASVRVPKYSLCGFKRIHLKSGEKKTVTFEVASNAMSIVDEAGKRHIENGEFTLYAGGSQPDKVSESLSGKKPLEASFNVK